jgi:hypothetical protein
MAAAFATFPTFASETTTTTTNSMLNHLDQGVTAGPVESEGHQGARHEDARAADPSGGAVGSPPPGLHGLRVRPGVSFGLQSQVSQTAASGWSSPRPARPARPVRDQFGRQQQRQVHRPHPPALGHVTRPTAVGTATQFAATTPSFVQGTGWPTPQEVIAFQNYMAMLTQMSATSVGDVGQTGWPGQAGGGGATGGGTIGAYAGYGFSPYDAARSAPWTEAPGMPTDAYMLAMSGAAMAMAPPSPLRRQVYAAPILHADPVIRAAQEAHQAKRMVHCSQCDRVFRCPEPCMDKFITWVGHLQNPTWVFRVHASYCIECRHRYNQRHRFGNPAVAADGVASVEGVAAGVDGGAASQPAE